MLRQLHRNNLTLVSPDKPLFYVPQHTFTQSVIGGPTVRILKAALLGATFLIGAAGVANAADVYDRKGSLKDAPDAYMPAITWTGFYVGAHAGGAFGGEVEVSAGDESASADIENAFTGGVHVGYNWQASSNWVIGIEGSASFLSQDLENDFEFTDYVASIRGRAGVTFDRSLLYATAGVAFLGYSDDAADDLDEDVAVGFVVGAGWERKLTDNVSFGVEGLYYNFETDVEGIDVESDFFTVMARLNYHFGARHDEALK
jgi:outer membrane immunogenic protein